MNKSAFAAVAYLFFTLHTQAQTEKGAVYLGGSLGVLSSNTSLYATGNSNNNLSQFSIAPSLAWAYQNNRFVGISLSWSNIDGTSGSVNSNINMPGATVYLRQYKPLGKSFYIFGQQALGFSYGFGKVAGYNYNAFQSSLAFSPGIAYTLSKHLQLELEMSDIVSVAYVNSRYTGDGSLLYVPENNNNFSFNTSLEGGGVNNLTFGVRYFL